MYDVNIKTIELPLNIRGLTVFKDGNRYIFINDLYELKTKNEILLEELSKIEGFSSEDFEKFRLTEGETID